MRTGVATVLFLLIAAAGSPPACAAVALASNAALEQAAGMGTQTQDGLSSGRLETSAEMAGRTVDNNGASGVIVEGRDAAGGARLGKAPEAGAKKKTAVPAPGAAGSQGLSGSEKAKIAGAGLLAGLVGYADDGLGAGILWSAIGLGAAYLMVKGQYGTAAGTAIGGIVGSIMGGPIGGLIGGLIGGILGHFLGNALGINHKKKE